MLGMPVAPRTSEPVAVNVYVTLFPAASVTGAGVAAQRVAASRTLESHMGVPVRAAVEWTSVLGVRHAGVKVIYSVVGFVMTTLEEKRIGLAPVTCELPT